MVDPISASLMAQAVTEVVKSTASEAGKQAWSSLTSLVRKVFGHDSEASTALVAIEQKPSDTTPVGMLAVFLSERARTDPAFAEELRTWLAAAPQTARTGNVTNSVSGSAQVTNLIQAGDIHGSITLGTPPPPPAQ